MFHERKKLSQKKIKKWKRNCKKKLQFKKIVNFFQEFKKLIEILRFTKSAKNHQINLLNSIIKNSFEWDSPVSNRVVIEPSVGHAKGNSCRPLPVCPCA